MATDKVELSFGSPLRIEVVQVQSQTSRAVWTWQVGSLIYKGENMSSTMSAGTTAEATVMWIDSFGNPAKVDGPTKWESSDDLIVTVSATPGPPTNRAQVVSVGPIGPAQIQATADADLGDGVKSITAILDVVVISGQATAGTIELSTEPEVQPVSMKSKK
jgi:hypothetical protein